MHLARHNCITGSWDFAASSLSIEEVGLIGLQLAATDTGYRRVFVRKVGPERVGLCFEYVPAERGNIRRHMRQLIERTSTDLTKAFGDDFLGWDISAPTWIVYDRMRAIAGDDDGQPRKPGDSSQAVRH